jgi:hypothetical protein
MPSNTNKGPVYELWHLTTRALFGRYRVGLLRWLRGRRDLKRLAKADVAVVSFAKSGRTWLRVMLSRLFQIKYGLPDHVVLEHDNLHQMDKAIPIFLFTHGGYIEDIRPIAGSSSPYRDKRLIVLARHPADTAVSFYFQNRNRTNPLKKDVKRLPQDVSQVSLFDFVKNEAWGMPAIVDFLNTWADGLAQHPNHLLVRYEDLRHDAKPHLKRIAQFMGEEFEEAAYDDAIDFASFERMQEKERADFFGNERLRPGDPDNPDSFKVRRGKIGGYRDYLSDEEVAWVEQEVRSRLHPMFGYAQPLAGDNIITRSASL